MQLKKTIRENRYGAAAERYSDGTIAVGLEEDDDQHLEDYSPMSQDPNSQPEATTVTRNREQQASVAVSPAVLNESVIDGNSTFEGKFETDQDLRILGSIGGEVICRGRLTIEKDAVARAKLQARDATIRGRIEGDIVCTGRLDLAMSAVVHGTIKAGLLAVEEGATVQGSVEVGNPPAIAPTRASSRKGESGSLPASPASNEEEDAPLPSFSSARMNRRESPPSFALVSSEERISP